MCRRQRKCKRQEKCSRVQICRGVEITVSHRSTNDGIRAERRRSTVERSGEQQADGNSTLETKSSQPEDHPADGPSAHQVLFLPACCLSFVAFCRSFGIVLIVVAIAVRVHVVRPSPIQVPSHIPLVHDSLSVLRRNHWGMGRFWRAFLASFCLTMLVGVSTPSYALPGSLTKSSGKAFLVVFWCLLVEREANAWRTRS